MCRRKNPFLEILKSAEYLNNTDRNEVRIITVSMWARQSPLVRGVFDGQQTFEEIVTPVALENSKLGLFGPKVCVSGQFGYEGMLTLDVHVSDIFDFEPDGVDLTSRVDPYYFRKQRNSFLLSLLLLAGVWLCDVYWLSSINLSAVLFIAFLLSFIYHFHCIEKYTNYLDKRKKFTDEILKDAQFLDEVIAYTRI